IAALSAGLNLAVGRIRQAKRVAVVAISFPLRRAHHRCGRYLLLGNTRHACKHERCDAGCHGCEGTALLDVRPVMHLLIRTLNRSPDALARLAPGAALRAAVCRTDAYIRGEKPVPRAKRRASASLGFLLMCERARLDESDSVALLRRAHVPVDR